MNEVICPYCHKPAIQVKGNTIYPNRPDLFKKNFFLCRPCGAYVGCHPGSATPLGYLANEETRRARSDAHYAFDPLWRGRSMKRKEVYQWLADHLGIDVSRCHIGEFNIDMCEKVVRICTERKDVP